MDHFLNVTLPDIISNFGIKLVSALAVFIIGRWIARLLKKLFAKVMTVRKVDPTVVAFSENLIYYALLTFVLLASMNRLGIQTTSFVAIIGAAGLAVGLALQGSLSNFAAGFLLIIFRPIKVGDYIEAAGTAGVVEKIQIFTTELLTPDNKKVIIPNSKLSGDNITNYSAEENRRVDFVFGVGYGDNIDTVRKIILEVLGTNDKILKDPESTVGIVELADSSVNFAVRPWVKTADYWDVYFDINEKMKKRFDAEGISIPFPQTDVHIHKVDEA